MSKIILTSGAAPSTPTSGTVALYSDANDTLRFKDDTGTDVGIVTVSVGGITTIDKLQFEDHGSNAQMWLIEEDSNNPTNALVFDYSGTERLRIMPSGDIADSNNNVVLSFSSTNEDGANWVDVKNNSTGLGPVISSVGADTNIDLNISAKGTGIVNLGSGGVRLNAPLDVNTQAITNVSSFATDGNVILSFQSGGELAVNWAEVVHATTGSGPIIRSVGADTNVDLVFDTKGTGDINASTNKIINVTDPTLAQDAATKNYVDNNHGLDNVVEDLTPQLGGNLDVNGKGISFGGPQLVLAFASGGEGAVNNLEIVHANTGSGPIVRSVGADTNIDLVLNTKGTGDIDVSTNKIINVVNPTSAQDAATKDYVDISVGFDLGEFTVAGLPTAASNANGYALATDASGGRTIVRSDGTDWKIVVVEGATVA